MIDIDRFNPINDKFGHAVGDAVLMAIEAACRGAVRSDDVIGRLGGEEFAMLMPLTDQETAYRIVDRLLREAVAAIAIPARRADRLGDDQCGHGDVRGAADRRAAAGRAGW